MSNLAQRQAWMATLAKASLEQLQEKMAGLEPLPQYSFLRPPEIGLTQVRGRAGGTGQIFNLGEMTLTRCVIKLHYQPIITGFGYVAGRSHLHAELAALADALMQHNNWCERVQKIVIEPLQAEAIHQQQTQQSQTASTQVNFFTLARGE
ncbi:phosphonate C-P lyase system protein PhnG [Lyngbya sp. PCC 8106]|uniref:phosphonate C-P lyase system protein PhnG n=1 Tax=Lyngbya sp. (strain PCC 8106) TaxID=313612 RepID=UPI0000EACABF|nr:phosphonate C-P lyase system protein PhnG [Lyngbya sp. PCC 8106]EAW34168.1 phosphonate metabolism protein [Lyngbya sp. PCC 8106]